MPVQAEILFVFFITGFFKSSYAHIGNTKFVEIAWKFHLYVIIGLCVTMSFHGGILQCILKFHFLWIGKVLFLKHDFVV